MKGSGFLGWIKCDIHGRQKAYFVCIHIKTAEDIFERTEWTPKGGGDLICKLGGSFHSAGEILLMCEAHLRGMGLLPAA
jgi:hypothetical protein